MLPLPGDNTDPIRLADWIEANTLLTKDGNCSIGDLQSALTSGSIFEENSPGLEATLAAVAIELDGRQSTSGGGYPFTFENGAKLQLKAATKTLDSVYVFCLLLSYLDWEQAAGVEEKAARMFEQISTEAARRFLGDASDSAKAFRFGSPRSGDAVGCAPKPFSSAIDKLAKVCIREGAGWKHGQKLPKDHHPADDGLDVVAWRDWADQRPGKLVLLGSCATGKDWDDKTYDLDTDDFFEEWVIDQPATPLVRAFFVPHRIRDSIWTTTTRQAGIIFDRCRIASLVDVPPVETAKHGSPSKWVQASLKRLAAL